MALTSSLAIVAIQARDEARDQRREAEGLVGFMLGDLRGTLEPIGRLDALDGVGSRVLTYYERQNKGSLTDEALAQRSRALTLLGEIASSRRDLDGALRRYREAMAGTAEALRRAPSNPQRLFDHAQNVFWVGEIARQRGNLDGAEEASREYQRLAGRMIAIDPGNPKWRMEGQYAATNLGIVLTERGQYAEASAEFEPCKASSGWRPPIRATAISRSP
jgi:tetratricopeptide (TPR) repeat protein